MEIWKLIKGFEGYEITNLGRVKSLAKNINYKDGRIRRTKDRILKLRKDGKGYYFVTLYNDTIATQTRVHQLVAQTFILNLDNKPCINHKDSNRLNNNVENLEWVTYKENTQHAIKTGRLYKPGKKIGKKEVEEIKLLWKKKGLNQYEIASKYFISQTQVSRIINNKNWKEFNHLKN